MRILFWPDAPRPEKDVTWHLCERGGHEILNDLGADCDVAFAYQYETDPCVQGLREVGLASGQGAINGLCHSIDKRVVQDAQEGVMGYGTRIEKPHRCYADMVIKSRANGTHDGRVLRGPIERPDLDEKVYEKVIDNIVRGRGGRPAQVEDLRVVLHLGRCPLVYRKRRPAVSRFGNRNDAVRLAGDEVFDPVKTPLGHDCVLDAVRRVAQAVEADYCEVDVLVDRRSKRPYVIDVNKTPYGPPNGLTPKGRGAALALLSLTFEMMLDRVARGEFRWTEKSPGPHVSNVEN